MRVFDSVLLLFCEKYGCEPEDVTMGASLDELGILPHERADMSLVLGETYGVAFTDDALAGFDTVEDIVGYVEDQFEA